MEDYVVVKTGAQSWEKQELLMKDSSVTLPASAPVGSVAYTADLSYMAMFNGEDWVEIGGSDE